MAHELQHPGTTAAARVHEHGERTASSPAAGQHRCLQGLHIQHIQWQRRHITIKLVGLLDALRSFNCHAFLPLLQRVHGLLIDAFLASPVRHTTLKRLDTHSRVLPPRFIQLCRVHGACEHEHSLQHAPSAATP